MQSRIADPLHAIKASLASRKCPENDAKNPQTHGETTSDNDVPALMLVDIQYDFLPGGALAVSEGDAILPVVHRLLKVPHDRWKVVVASQDWHPPGHISFASTHGPEPFTTLDMSDPYAPTTAATDKPESDSSETSRMITQTVWPDHCVQGTHGAEFEISIEAGLKPWTDAGKCIIIQKGDDPRLDAYSPFAPVCSLARAKEREQMLLSPSPFPSSSSATSLVQTLRTHNVRTLILVGLALDFCVRHAALDAAHAGFRTLIVLEGSRAVSKEGAEETKRELASAGVELVSIDGPELRKLLGVECISGE